MSARKPSKLTRKKKSGGRPILPYTANRREGLWQLPLSFAFFMPDQPDQKQSGTNTTFYEAVVQAIELWNKTPTAVLDQQLAHDYALLQAMGKYMTERKQQGQLDACDDASEFLDHLVKGL